MNWTLPLVAVAAAFGQDDVKKITPDELKQLIAEKVFFLDVRTPKEVQELGTLKGYVNIPVEDLEKRMNEIPKNVKIVTA
jgi:rhodanese-related sulfurtransferase